MGAEEYRKGWAVGRRRVCVEWVRALVHLFEFELPVALTIQLELVFEATLSLDHLLLLAKPLEVPVVVLTLVAIQPSQSLRICQKGARTFKDFTKSCTNKDPYQSVD